MAAGREGRALEVRIPRIGHEHPIDGRCVAGVAGRGVPTPRSRRPEPRDRPRKFMSTTDTDPQPTQEPVLPRSHRLIRHLALLYGALTLAVALALAGGWLPASIAPQLRMIAREAIA